MTPTERLNLYEAALKDYEESAKDWSESKCIQLQTQYGFCHYYAATLGLNLYISDCSFKRILPELYGKRETNCDVYHYSFSGYESIYGITDRIKALKAAIKEVKTKIQNNEYNNRKLQHARSHYKEIRLLHNSPP